MIGLHASALSRLAVGAAFCLGAVGLVWWVERPDPSPPVPRLVAAVVGKPLRLAVESSYAVATWRVLVLGVEQPVSSSDAWNWRGVVQAPSGEEVVVIATATPGDAVAHHALRLRLGDAPERLVWGAGDVVISGTAP